MSRPLLQIDHLKTYFRSAKGLIPAVDDVSFTIGEGESFALVGESGCGKSVTALSIMRLLQPPAFHAGGTIIFKGMDLTALSDEAMRAIRGNSIAMIFQEPMTSLNPVFTIGNQIIEAIRLHQGLSKTAARQRAIEMLDRVGISDAAARYNAYPHQLSGGMQQRAMIAIALACHPQLLIADEPTTALDVTIQDQILTLLQALRTDLGMAMLLITHDLALIYENADRVAVMYAGTIVETAATGQLFASPMHPYTRQLFQSIPARGKRGRLLYTIPGAPPRYIKQTIGCRFADRCHQVMSLCRTSFPHLQEVEKNHFSACHLAANNISPVAPATLENNYRNGGVGPNIMPHVPAKTLLSVNNLCVHFPVKKGILKRVVGFIKAVDGVDVQVIEGMTMALVGESGSGKTTLGKAVLGLLTPTNGSVTFDGVNLACLSRKQMRDIRKNFQIVFQDPFASLNPRMMVKDIIEEPMLPHGIGKNRTDRIHMVRTAMESVGLDESLLNRYPHEFSGGQRQRIALARVLTLKPRLLICDEATSALDVSIQAQILNLLNELKKRYTLTYLFITHNLSVVEYLADMIAVMYLGRIVESGTTGEVIDQAKHPYTRALLASAPSCLSNRHERLRLVGDIPSPLSPPRGCHFHPRCSFKMPRCETAYPPQVQFTHTHSCRCYLYAH